MNFSSIYQYSCDLQLYKVSCIPNTRCQVDVAYMNFTSVLSGHSLVFVELRMLERSFIFGISPDIQVYVLTVRCEMDTEYNSFPCFLRLAWISYI